MLKLFDVLISRYLEIVHPVWHKTHFKKKWLYISFAVIWPFGFAFNAVTWIPAKKVNRGKRYLSVINMDLIVNLI